MEEIIKKDQDSSIKSVELVTDYLENYKYDKALSYLKDIHNADIADVLQNLDPVLRLSLLNLIDKNFDPEILTYLNDSVREEIIETLEKNGEDLLADNILFRCNKLGHTTDECKMYSSFDTESGHSFDRVPRDRDVLAADYEVPGPGSNDVKHSSFSILNEHKKSSSKRRGSDSHIVHDKNCDERLWNDEAVEESSFWMTFQIANMPPYFRHRDVVSRFVAKYRT